MYFILGACLKVFPVQLGETDEQLLTASFLVTKN